jgi:hypothetical protein
MQVFLLPFVMTLLKTFGNLRFIAASGLACPRKKAKNGATLSISYFFPIPGFFPFLQLDFGLKARPSRNFHLLITNGVWGGFLVCGGLSIRL